MGEPIREERSTASGPLAGRIWLSTAVTEAGAQRPLVPGTRIRTTFSAGTLTVDAGCNMLSIPVTVEADRLITGAALSTLIGCSPEREAQDEWIAESLGNGDLGWCVAEGTLTLAQATPGSCSRRWRPRFARTRPLRCATGTVPAPVVADTTIGPRSPPRPADRAGGLQRTGLPGGDRRDPADRRRPGRLRPDGLHRGPRGPRPSLTTFLTDDPGTASTTTRSPSRARAPRSCWRPCPVSREVQHPEPLIPPEQARALLRIPLDGGRGGVPAGGAPRGSKAGPAGVTGGGERDVFGAHQPRQLPAAATAAGPAAVTSPSMSAVPNTSRVSRPWEAPWAPNPHPSSVVDVAEPGGVEA